MDPTDIPLVQPRKTSSLGNSYLDYLSISTLRLDRGQWDKLPEIKKEAILDWVTMGGFFEQTESPGESNGLLKKYPPMNFSNRKYNQYGRGKLIEKKLFSNDYGSGSIVANRGEFSPSPSWEVRLISPGLFIPAVVIFALIIGPGAIFYSRRKKNPALVLALIPIISLISCVIILILSILNDGISPKVCRQMITYLDQTRGKALTQQITGVEAPLGLNSPVEFPEDSIVVLSAKLSSSSGGYCVVENGTIKLNSFVQARIPAFFGMSRLEKRRERLEIKEENESVKVMNGLGCGIEKLLLRDSKGNYWHKEEMIPPGKEAALNRCYDGAGKKQYAGFQLSNLLSSELKHSGYLGYGCYQARLTKNVFGVEGVKSNREVGDNFSILIGRYIKVNN
jgi:hypothetical protein